MGFAKAAAAIMQAAAPNVGNAYTNAANATAGYARGLGTSVQAPLDQSYQSNAAFLAKMGTPSSGIKTAPPVGDIAYGLQGYIPASSMQREGAAWESAAQLAPGNVLAQGQQAAAGTLASDPQLASLQSELAKVAATYPDVYQKLLSTLNEQAYRNATLGQAQQRIGLEGQSLQLRANEAKAMNAYRAAELQFKAAGLALSQKRESDSLKKAMLKGQMPDASLSKVYGYVVDGNGNPILNGKGRRIKVVKSSGSSSGLPPWASGGPGKNPKGAGSFAGVGQDIGKAVSGIGNTVQRGAAKIILRLANEFIGTPYVWGGESSKGFDCSGFAQYLYGKAGIGIPRDTYSQWLAPNAISVSRKGLEPGDLVYYKGSDSKTVNGRLLPGHVGVYIGGGKIIDAYGTGYGVRVDSVFSPMMGGYMGARRFHK